jgi:hypothetical protein
MWYENTTVNNCYESLDILINNHDLKTKNAIIFLVNNDNGFGSNLTVLIQNMLYLKSINNNLHVLGHFSINGHNFKYHDSTVNNSFFYYFKYLKEIENNIEIYYVKLNFINYNFIELPPTFDNITNKLYSDTFKNNFTLKIGNNISNQINEIKENTTKLLIGLHIRSLAQIISVTNDKNEKIENRITTIKNMLDKQYSSYNLFIATDVQEYIDIIIEKYKNTDVKIYFNNFISRIKDHGDGKNGLLYGYNDSIINLYKYTGFKLGEDIINDCLSLINCDYYYVSITNIAFITMFLNNNNNWIIY